MKRVNNQYSNLSYYLCIILVLSSFTLKAQIPGRQNRADCFFGIHFDFHATQADSSIGASLSKVMIDSFLEIVKPDFIQIDAKGHPGYASFPTKKGSQAGRINQDAYPLFRQSTKEQGVRLYSHYSGVRDDRAVELHPSWARKDIQGNKDIKATSVFRQEYVDSLMIPQIKELIDWYQIDGIWVDGECWAAEPDFSTMAYHLYTKITGNSNLPKSITDEDYPEFLEFNRIAFHEYLKRYVNELHQYKPGFEITSNWAFSSHMPEPVDVALDFLSGDLPPRNSVYGAAFEARCLAPQGKPWDLMSWSFARDWDSYHTHNKTTQQILQEAAEVLAMGGGFQLYAKQNRDASLQPHLFHKMAEIASFCRAREEICHKATPVKQIALFYSSEGFKKATNTLYQPWNNELRTLQGTLQLLLDGQFPVEIQMDHHLQQSMNEYPLIVIPDWKYINKDVAAKLVQYVKDGGNIILIGVQVISQFESLLGITRSADQNPYPLWLGYNNMMAGIDSCLIVKAGENTQVFSSIYKNDFRFPISPASTITRLGKGKIAAIYTDIGSTYTNKASVLHRELLAGLVHELYPDPTLSISGTGKIHVSLMTKNNKIQINLINASGSHKDPTTYVYDDITPQGPFIIKLKSEKKPSALYLEPGHRVQEFTYEDNTITVTIEKVDIHEIIVVE